MGTGCDVMCFISRGLTEAPGLSERYSMILEKDLWLQIDKHVSGQTEKDTRRRRCSGEGSVVLGEGHWCLGSFQVGLGGSSVLSH